MKHRLGKTRLHVKCIPAWGLQYFMKVSARKQVIMPNSENCDTVIPEGTRSARGAVCCEMGCKEVGRSGWCEVVGWSGRVDRARKG
eukprot:1192270-Prorocentrum_minimum.AAC.14